MDRRGVLAAKSTRAKLFVKIIRVVEVTRSKSDMSSEFVLVKVWGFGGWVVRFVETDLHLGKVFFKGFIVFNRPTWMTDLYVPAIAARRGDHELENFPSFSQHVM